jgi:hypothetical protein
LVLAHPLGEEIELSLGGIADGRDDLGRCHGEVGFDS